MDVELGYSVFAENSVADYGPNFQGTGREFIDWCCMVHSYCVYTSHQVSNILIAVDDDAAGSEAYCTAGVVSGQEGAYNCTIVRVRYNATWERREGDWVIVKRTVSGDISFAYKTESLMDAYNTSRDTEDPSYGVLF